jgi:predicted porin
VSPSPVHFTPSLEFFMKKTMVMAACLMVTALGAQAQSSVQLMGLADGYVGSMRMAGDTASKSVMGSGGMTTSWWGMKGTEDLGNGLKANVALTGFLRIDSGSSGRYPGDTMFSRDANVGLSGDFGTVTAGRGLAPNFLPTVIFNPIGDSFTFSPLVLHANVPLTGWAKTTPDDTGWSSEVIYTTPNFSGLSANLHYQVADVAGASGKNNVGFNALYFAGPLALTAFWERDQLKGPVLVSIGSTKTDWMLGGSYDAKVAKAYMTYGQSSTDLNSTKGKTLSLGVSAPISANGKLLAAYATTKMTAGNTRDTLTVGYDHNLSKRTDVYAMVMHDQITTFSSGTSVGVGVRHRF